VLEESYGEREIFAAAAREDSAAAVEQCLNILRNSHRIAERTAESLLRTASGDWGVEMLRDLTYDIGEAMEKYGVRD